MGVDPHFVMAVDFGLYSIKMALFERDKKTWKLMDYGEAPVTDPRSSEALSEHIRGFLSRSPRVKKPAMIATLRHAISEKPITLPEMPRSEVGTAIRFSVERSFGITVKESFSDYIFSRSFTSSEGIKSRQYFFYTLGHKDSGAPLDALRSVSENILSIVPSSVAYGIVLDRFHKIRSEDFGVLDVGYNNSTVLIFRGDKPLLSRLIPVGGMNFDLAIKMAANTSGQGVLSAEEVENMKRRISLLPDREQVSEADVIPGALPRLRACVEKLQEELILSLDYYNRQGFGGKIGRFYLCGGGANIKGLERILEAGSEIPFEKPQWKGVDEIRIARSLESQFKEDSAAFIPVMGALLVGTGKGPNLAPVRFAAHRRRKILTRVLKMTFFTLSMVAIFINTYLATELGGLEREWKGLELHVQNAITNDAATVPVFLSSDLIVTFSHVKKGTTLSLSVPMSSATL